MEDEKQVIPTAEEVLQDVMGQLEEGDRVVVMTIAADGNLETAWTPMPAAFLAFAGTILQRVACDVSQGGPVRDHELTEPN